MVRLFGGGRPKDADVLAALRQVKVSEGGSDVVAAGLVQGISVHDGRVAISLEVDPRQAEAMESVRKACEEAAETVSGVRSATAVLTAESEPGRPADADAARPLPPAPETSQMPGPQPLPGVDAIVAVASGKGGVGKSTTAINLALGFKALGMKTGILDADIYGPSLPRMMAISDRPEAADDKTLLPLEKFGLACMSIGFMVPEDTATIWRGPMVSSALRQMLTGVLWGDLDVLVVDLPPGTGDAQLTMAQQVPITGVVIVSTPQDIALVDARKGMAMFSRVGVPVFGFVENMSYFACPHCGERTEIFSHGGARQWARDLGTDFLGEIPLHVAIRETSDKGEPIVVSRPESAEAKAFMDIAERVAEKIGLALEAQAGPATRTAGE